MLESFSASAPEDIQISTLFKQANFIDSAITNVELALRDGAIIVAFVLILFLLNTRTTIITLTAIPLSMIISAIVFKIFGMSINTMTLGGLAIAIGEMVDDAIVDVENVFRRLRENNLSPNPKPILEVIYEASVEVRGSIVYATALVVLVFIPLFALSGIEGRLFAPIGVAYIASILASLIVAVTVTPVLCSYLLPNMKHMKHEKDGWLVRKLKELDEKYLLRPALNHPWKTIFIAAGLVIFSFLLYPIMGKTFLPEFNEGTLTISLYTAPGTSLEQSNKIGTLAEKLILSVPEVVSVGRRTGRAEQDEHAEGLHSSEIDVDLKTSDRTREKILDSIRKKLSQIPGTTYNVGQPISHRLDHLQSGVRAQIALKISGDNLETLRDLANKTEHAIKDIPGVVDLQIEKQTLIPQLRIEVDREQVVAYGVQPGALTEILEVALNGKIVSQVIDGQKTYDLVVQYESNSRSNPEVIRQMLIDTNSGYKVPLSHLAKVFEAKGPNVINRENGRRRIVISCNASGRALDEVVRDIENTFNSTISLPSGYSVSYEGQFQSQKNASSLIGILSAVVLLAIFFILYSFFKSTTVVLQILINIPLSFIGALTLTYLLIGTISVATLVGLIALAGIASRNTIMMISHYLHLMEYEGENFSPQMIIRGSLERLVPVTMTALTAGLGLLPLVFAAGEPGKEILYPVAVVILGGLVSSTILDMAVTPAVFLKFGKPRS